MFLLFSIVIIDIYEEGQHYYHYKGNNIGMEVIIETLIALKCQYFIGNGLSGPSAYIYCAKDWQDEANLLVGCLFESNITNLFKSPEFHQRRSARSRIDSEQA